MPNSEKKSRERNPNLQYLEVTTTTSRIYIETTLEGLLDLLTAVSDCIDKGKGTVKVVDAYQKEKIVVVVKREERV